VTTLPLGNSILSRRVRTRLLRKGAVRGELITKRSGEILAGTIRTKYLDAFAKLSMNHLRELAVDRKHIRTGTHKVKPCISREIINKAHIVGKAPKRGGPQISECTRSKGAAERDSLNEKERA